MNWKRITLGSVLAACCCASLLAGEPVLANTSAHAPIPADLFVIRAPWPQEQEKKVFPKVDPKDEIPLPEGEGKAITKKTCGNCHSTNVWINQRHTTAKWSQIIDNMATKGMEASDDDLAIINDYLGKYLAPPPKDATPATPPPAPPQQ
jgi:cytochrome c5